MKKFLKVPQDEGKVSVVQVDYQMGKTIAKSFATDYAGVTVLKGPALTFGQWLFIFKKEILEEWSEEIQSTLDKYNEYYREASKNGREVTLNGPNYPCYYKPVIDVAFEKYEGESDCIDYRFIEKRYKDLIFHAGIIHIETFHVSMYGKINKKPPKNIYVLLALWKKFSWNNYISETEYEEFTPKEYDFEEAPVLLSVEDF